MNLNRIKFIIYPNDGIYDSSMRFFRALQEFSVDTRLYVTIETKNQYRELRKKLAKRAAKKRK